MAKKVSKHSRAARRGLVDEGSNEAKELANIPKDENSDVRKSIIRTTIKNENLLNKKIENQRIKKMNKKSTSALKHRLDRSTKIEGILSHKVQQSMDRARYVQRARKAGWDQINKNISIKNDLHDENSPAQPEPTEEELEKMEEDKYVAEFYKDNAEKDEEEQEQQKPDATRVMNKFALLEETEA